MGYKYIKEEPDIDIKEKSEEEKKIELLYSFVKTRDALENARKNFEYADQNLVDYYLYEIKANQSKLDYIIAKAKQLNIEFDLASSFFFRNKKAV